MSGITRNPFRQCLLVLGCLVTLLPQSAALASAPELTQPTVLITGSNRGIGFALARIYAERGWGVIASCRSPNKADDLRELQSQYPQVVIEQLDVTDLDGIDALAARYRDVPIDLLINNAGILGGNERQKFGAFDYAAFDEVIDSYTRKTTGTFLRYDGKSIPW